MALVQQKMLEREREARQRRSRKHKLHAGADGSTPSKRGRPRKEPHSLEEDLQYSDSGGSELEEVQPARSQDDLSTGLDTGFPPPPVEIKREIPDEPPHASDDFVDLDDHTDYSFPPVVKEEPMEPDMNMDHPMEGPSLAPPQLKEEPMENWQPDPAIQDDLQVTDSEEEAEDGLWF